MIFFMFIMGLMLMVWGLVSLNGICDRSASKKGSFKVSAYKNGELVFLKTYTNESFIVGPGDKWDKVIIE